MKHVWAKLCMRATLASACLAPAWAAEPEAASASFDAALREADRRFVAGDLEGALRLIEPVCSDSERPECTFSLGAIHHGLGHCPLARAFYRSYLARWPGGEHEPDVRDALVEVEARCGGPGDVAPPAEVVPSPGVSPEGVPGNPGLPRPVVGPVVEAAVPRPEQTFLREAPARSLSADLAVGSLALAGVAAVSSVAFGLLAVHDAGRCSQATTYDSEYIERCENAGPRYQGLWQGFAVASGSFLGIGLALWAFDPGPAAATAVSGPAPQLGYRGRF